MTETATPTFEIGDTVEFATPNGATYRAKVTAKPVTTAGRGGGTFMETTDEAGKVRRVRPVAARHV